MPNQANNANKPSQSSKRAVWEIKKSVETSVVLFFSIYFTKRYSLLNCTQAIHFLA